jgi:predicted dehydrogenase
MSGELRIGVIGTGQIGNHHLTTWQTVQGAKVVAICDIDEPKLQAVGEKFGIARRFVKFRDLLAEADIDAVDVCVHNNLHAPIAILSMEAGKHVYTEKPMAGSYVDAHTMLQASRRTGRRLHMQIGTLFESETRAAKRLIDEGHLGRIYYAKSSSYRRRGRPFVDGYGTQFFVQKSVAGGGALYDMGVYHISRILFLLGNPRVLTISGAAHQEIDMYADRRDQGGYSVEELGVGLVRLEGGVTFFIEEAWAIHLGGTDGSKIAGSQGGVTLKPFAFHATVGDMEMNALFDLASAQTRWKSCFPDTAAFAGSQPHWAAALRGEVELLPTAEIGLNTMLISEGVYLSQQLGREVTAEEVLAKSVSTQLVV